MLPTFRQLAVPNYAPATASVLQASLSAMARAVEALKVPVLWMQRWGTHLAVESHGMPWNADAKKSNTGQKHQ
jgi:hypothetical protein